MHEARFSTFHLLWLPLLPLALPLPTQAPCSVTTETWTIPRLEMHMMMPTSGLPGGFWPPSAYFDSTIDFDIGMPSPGRPATTASVVTANCRASFANGTLPVGVQACSVEAGREEEMGGKVVFWMDRWEGLGSGFRAELSYALGVARVVSTDNVWTGSVNVSSNKPSEPSSFMTCLLGPPLDGLRCRIHSYLSVDKEMKIEAWGRSDCAGES